MRFAEGGARGARQTTYPKIRWQLCALMATVFPVQTCSAFCSAHAVLMCEQACKWAGRQEGVTAPTRMKNCSMRSSILRPGLVAPSAGAEVPAAAAGDAVMVASPGEPVPAAALAVSFSLLAGVGGRLLGDLAPGEEAASVRRT